MKKSSLVRIGMVIIGLALVIDGAYNVYMGLGGKDKKEDNIAKENPGHIGEAISDENGVEFCVTSVERAQEISSNGYQVSTDNNFVVVGIEITNNSNEPYNINGLDFLLINGEREYEASSDLDIMGMYENYLYLDTINPGLKEDYIILYEIPVSSSNTEFYLKIYDNSLLDKVAVYIDLK